MEFKSINNYRMKWFGIDEIRNLDEINDKLPFIEGFSFGPFVPYYLYNFFHNLWDLYILQIAANLIMVYIMMIGYYTFYFYAIIKGTFSAIQNIESDGTSPIEFLGEFFISHLSMIIIIVFIFVFLFLIVEFGIKIYTGKHSRKLSWNRCEWKSYEDFEQGEKNWHIAGMIFFILRILSLVFAFILLIIGFVLLKNYLPSLKDLIPTGNLSLR